MAMLCRIEIATNKLKNNRLEYTPSGTLFGEAGDEESRGREPSLTLDLLIQRVRLTSSTRLHIRGPLFFHKLRFFAVLDDIGLFWLCYVIGGMEKEKWKASLTFFPSCSAKRLLGEQRP